MSVTLGTQFDPSSTSGEDQMMRAYADIASSRSPEAQSIVWVKDGVVIAGNGPVTADPRYMYQLNVIGWANANVGQWATDLTISDFQSSDAGVYQVIFTDFEVSGLEVLTTTPIRLDSGEHIHIDVVVILIKYLAIH